MTAQVASRVPAAPVAAALVAALVFGHASPALAYLKFGLTIGGQETAIKWSRTPIRYFVTNRTAAGIDPQQFQTTVSRAFATWHAVASASIDFQFVGFTQALPLDDDGASTLGFRSRPDLDRVLASTSLLVDLTTGELLEADIFFNSAFAWSTAAGGESGRYDLESVALHEIGHFSGLGHSALGETQRNPNGGRQVIAAGAVMFPIAYAAGTTVGRTLTPDDMAGISDAYSGDGFDEDFGSASGTVTRNGAGVFGAHIAAFSLDSGILVANFALNRQGRFSIAGLPPGPYVLRAEPLDDVDIDGFFDPDDVDVGFRVTFLDRIVVVPRGGDSGAVEIKVVPR